MSKTNPTLPLISDVAQRIQALQPRPTELRRLAARPTVRYHSPTAFPRWDVRPYR